MAFYNFFDEGQARACTFLILDGRVLEPFKDAEDGLVEFRTYTNAVILDVENIFLTPMRRFNLLEKAHFNQALRLVIIFDGIRYQVAENLGDPELVANDAGHALGDRYPHIALFEERVHHLPDFADNLIGVNFFHSKLSPAQPGEIQEIRDQLLHALAQVNETAETAYGLHIQLLLVVIQQEGRLRYQTPHRFF